MPRGLAEFNEERYEQTVQAAGHLTFTCGDRDWFIDARAHWQQELNSYCIVVEINREEETIEFLPSRGRDDTKIVYVQAVQ